VALKKPDELFEEKVKVETPVEVEELQREGALKKPAELFEEKIEVETPVEVEVSETPEGGCATRKDQLTNVTDSSLSEEIDKNLNLLSEEYSEKLNKFNHKIDTIKEEINIKLDGIEKTNKSLKGEIGVVEERQSKINLNKLKEEVISEIQKLEYKIDIIKEAYEENILKEGLLNEPPSTDNEDPLTPLDQKFATIDDLNNHYQLFLNRIQQQLSTVGGGGAVNIRDLDDVDISTARVNDKFLRYDSSSSKWVGADPGDLSNISTNTLNVIGLSTHRNGINVAGLSYLDGDVAFVGQNTNALWDKSKSDLVLYNDTRLTLGSNEDFQMWHGGSHTFIKNTGGDLRIRGNVIKLAREDSTERYIECNVNNAVQIFYNGNEKLATTNTGINVTGDAKVGVSTAQGVILTSPNGTEYRLIVANDGTLSTTAV